MLKAICANADCWDATGSMMQGWGTLAAVAVAAYAANTFRVWRRQRQEERRMEAAERILTVVYRLRDLLMIVRGTVIWERESKAAETDLAKQTWFMALPKEEQDLHKEGHVVLRRLDRYKDELQQIFSLMPVALAFFGNDVEDQLLLVWKQVVVIQTSAEAFGASFADPASRQDLRNALFAGNGQSVTEDKVTSDLKEAISALESVMLPIIRADYRRSKMS